jgi:hypothetical protein
MTTLGRMKRVLLSIVLASSFATTPACYTEADYPGGVDEGNADLVEVSPGVEVIADWDEPIFFVGGLYWVNRGGFWYSSGWYRGGWERAGVVPEGVRGIAHPEGFAHYRPAGWVAHEPVHGGYASHAQYHAAHAAGGGYHVRAAVRGHR